MGPRLRVLGRSRLTYDAAGSGKDQFGAIDIGSIRGRSPLREAVRSCGRRQERVTVISATT